ncbi:MAG: fibronectin type III domain-containing protein [Saprospiraceae bacterium]|nr:fibronectin type III domain-containing protein [Saprospiraceae bacterium]
MVTGNISAILSWQSGSPAGSPSITYYWVVGTSPTVTYGNGVAQNSTSSTSVSTSALAPGITYYLRVYAFTNCNNSTSGYATSFPFTTNSACIEPTIQISNISFSDIGTNTMTANWTIVNTNISRSVIYINTTNSFTPPVNGTEPLSNSIYSNSGQQCIYNGVNNSVMITGLLCNTIYYFRAYEANCTSTSSVYNISTSINNPNSQITYMCSCTDGIKNGNETGVDCGGSCPPCGSCLNTIVEIKTDQYPSEISWNIKNSAGVIVASNGSYSINYSLNTHSYCLYEGCYSFNITDTYGDGILSPGFFKVSQGNSVLINNSPYSSSATFYFCLGIPPAPNCTDGIKNGNETGIDCGGSCVPCPNCSDGIKNGNETGIDCGGDCAPCPTCFDGIKNGYESGIDCGGPCLPCQTCFDGIKNGSETGVDCGGSCTPCPTCSDGIKNGTETGVDCGGTCPVCPTCNDGIKMATRQA